MNQVNPQSLDSLVLQYHTLRRDGYMKKKIDAAIALAPETPLKDVINRIYTETVIQLSNFIFYLTSEEWQSSEMHSNSSIRFLNFKGRTPEPSKFNLWELDNMARLISMRIQGSFDRAAWTPDSDKIGDWDDAPTGRAWRNSTLATIKHLCRQNNFPLRVSTQFAWACKLNDPQMQEICKPETAEEERLMIGNLKQSGEAFERIDIVAQYITSAEIAGRIFVDFLGSHLLFQKLYTHLQGKMFFQNGILGKIIFEMIKVFKQTNNIDTAGLKKAVTFMIHSSKDEELKRADIDQAQQFCAEHPNLKEIDDALYEKLGQYEF